MFKNTWLSKTLLSKKNLAGLAYCIIAAGIIIRLVVYLQNRDLFIDEANLARNIYERGFLELLRPLDYEQYAPPIFLFILKISTLTFGYSEYAYRIYPLLAGMGTLFVSFSILREITSFRSLWYPLLLLASGFMFIRFGSELKQHGCDMLVVLSLVWLTLKTDIMTTKPARFIILWIVVGSIAIWISMPSVFILAALAISYFYTSLAKKDIKKMASIALIGTCWLLQFLFYYLTILKKQANSNYILSTLSDYYVFLTPNSKEQLMHNWYLFRSIIILCCGGTFLAWFFGFILFIIAALSLLVKNTARGLLLILPIVFTFLASAFHQYAILERYILFLTPLFILLVGVGFDVALKPGFIPLRLALLIIAAICVVNYNSFYMLYKPFKNEQLTEELAFLKKNNIAGEQLYVNNGTRPAYIYYTQIHPQRQQWEQFKNAHLLWWDVNYDELAQHITEQSAFAYSALGNDELKNLRTITEKHLKLENYIENPAYRCYVYIYFKP